MNQFIINNFGFDIYITEKIVTYLKNANQFAMHQKKFKPVLREFKKTRKLYYKFTKKHDYLKHINERIYLNKLLFNSEYLFCEDKDGNNNIEIFKDTECEDLEYGFLKDNRLLKYYTLW